MATNELRRLVDASNNHVVAIESERTMHDSLSAQNLSGTEVAERIRAVSRDAEDRVIDHIVALAEVLKSHNREVQRAAKNALLVEEARQKMQQRDSMDAMYPAQEEAKAVLVELNELRTIGFRQIAKLAISRYSTDGRSVWTDSPADNMLPDEIDLFRQSETEALNDEVKTANEARTRAAAGAGAGADPSLADQEIDEVLF